MAAKSTKQEPAADVSQETKTDASPTSEQQTNRKRFTVQVNGVPQTGSNEK